MRCFSVCFLIVLPHRAAAVPAVYFVLLSSCSLLSFSHSPRKRRASIVLFLDLHFENKIFSKTTQSDANLIIDYPTARLKHKNALEKRVTSFGTHAAGAVAGIRQNQQIQGCEAHQNPNHRSEVQSEHCNCISSNMDIESKYCTLRQPPIAIRRH